MRYLLVMIAVAQSMACNSRPPYYRQLWEFRTTCEGGLAITYEIDPDPDIDTRRVLEISRGPASKAELAELTGDRYNQALVLKSGTRCVLDDFKQAGTCMDQAGNQLDCEGGRRLLRLLKPTIDPDKEPVADVSPESSRDLLESPRE